ncbi:MAG: type II toxin-antitoxin system Phd/YefM family antitoxin [bacterium]|nr:type II toxin-antitoxin system Phd/YefM family antitoxin [bacterium]
MKVYTYSQARQRLSEVLDTALREEVLIRRRGRETFSLVYKTAAKSPFDVPGIKTKATTRDIVDAVRESRSGSDGPASSNPTSAIS